MISFAVDASLLSDNLTVIDLERIRKRLFGLYDHSRVHEKRLLDYEMFYKWLREISSSIYDVNGPDDDKRKSLHHLLTEVFCRQFSIIQFIVILC